MNENSRRPENKSPERSLHPRSDCKFEYLLRAEEQLLQSICARAPLPHLLNGICSALDCQIADVVSNISLPEDDPIELAAIAEDAALFGLYPFHSTNIIAGSGEAIGSLAMYCRPLRSPTAIEFQLIERATCLAAIAIGRHNESADCGGADIREELPADAKFPDRPIPPN